MQEKIIALYERTIRNCKFYEREHKLVGLANEIGVLQGVAYCMEVMGLCFVNDDFVHFIDLQEELKKGR